MTKLLLSVVMLLALGIGASAQHEYAPVQEKAINYKNWTFKTLDGKSEVTLRDWVKGKKLVLIVYYAPWCGNWKFEAPVLARLYEKYKEKGFDVVAVNEYGTVEQAKDYFQTIGGAAYTVVVESTDSASRDKTTHFAYRKAAGDSRNWGSPFNVFLMPEYLPAEGELLAEKTWVVGGELIEEDIDKFIREHLGLD